MKREVLPFDEIDAAQRLLDRYALVSEETIARDYPCLPVWLRNAALEYFSGRVSSLEDALYNEDVGRLRYFIDEALEHRAIPPRCLEERRYSLRNLLFKTLVLRFLC